MVESPEIIPELVTKKLREEALNQEVKRITPTAYPKVLNDAELVHLIKSKPGPRLVIMNTVQSAAVLAEKLRIEDHYSVR